MKHKYVLTVERWLVAGVLGTMLVQFTLTHAAEFQITLPSFLDLGSKWALVSLGTPPETVTEAMGSVAERTESHTLGVAHLTLVWRDLKYRYTARFVAGRLYNKDMSNAVR